MTVSVTSGDDAGLGAVSAIYNLTAIDAVTGAVIEHFGSAPVLSIAVGDDTGAGASIYYLPADGAPQAIDTTYEGATGLVRAGLPHFSTYAVLFSIESVLQQYATNAITGDHTFTPGDLVVGGVVDIAAPSLTFDITSSTGTGAGATFNATVTITAASATISTAPVTAAFGAVSGTYALVNQTAGEGTLTITLGGPSITVAGLAALSAATAELVSHDDGTTTTTTIGAANVTATVSAGAGGPAVTVTSPAFGLVASDPDAAGSHAGLRAAGHRLGGAHRPARRLAERDRLDGDLRRARRPLGCERDLRPDRLGHRSRSIPPSPTGSRARGPRSPTRAPRRRP